MIIDQWISPFNCAILTSKIFTDQRFPFDNFLRKLVYTHNYVSILHKSIDKVFRWLKKRIVIAEGIGH